jgi:hypothetical protein
MKKVRLLVLSVILVAVVANGSPRRWIATGALCGFSNDPALCNGTEDTGCSNFCATACDGFINVTSDCSLPHRCTCHGTPIP